jgi:SAM-dependent methyltransferase
MALQERTLPGLHAALMPYVQSLGLPADSRILDVGCGTGAWLKRLHEAGFRELCGIDRDAGSFQASDIGHFTAGDLDAAPAFARDFALVTMIEIIEHVENPYGLVEIAVKALVPGGWLLITSPNIYSLRARLRFLVRARLPQFEQSSRAPFEKDHIHPVVLDAFRRKVFDRLNLAAQRVWTFPEKGSDGSRLFARLITKGVGLILPDDLPGDTLCFLLRKPQGICSPQNYEKCPRDVARHQRDSSRGA